MNLLWLIIQEQILISSKKVHINDKILILFNSFMKKLREIK